MAILLDFSVILILLVGIWQFREPRGARSGNLTAAAALLSAFVLVVYRHGVIDAGMVTFALVAGTISGVAVASRVNMIQIPAMVAFQHGAGGVAAFLVAFVELTRDAQVLDFVGEMSGVLGLAIGSLTFGGSMVASAKLSNKIRQVPHLLPAHDVLLLFTIGAFSALAALSFYLPADIRTAVYLAQILLGTGFGVLFAIRIGGADMPVLISFLNATAGLAASLCGMVIANQLLIAFGATVAASGSILTHVMCKAMNRSMVRVFWPRFQPPAPPEKSKMADSPPQGQAAVAAPSPDRTGDAAAALAAAKRVIIIPGYGMALAKAQFNVVAMAALLRRRGATVSYAIHPVAGRMPGHMNVILAEADVDYDDLLEMDEANPLFAETDVALVIGACDVVNPAAIQTQGTPISGMPILEAYAARAIVACNFDEKPGYSGVANPLYQDPKTIMITGDAKASTDALMAALGLPS